MKEISTHDSETKKKNDKLLINFRWAAALLFVFVALVCCCYSGSSISSFLSSFWSLTATSLSSSVSNSTFAANIERLIVSYQRQRQNQHESKSSSTCGSSSSCRSTTRSKKQKHPQSSRTSSNLITKLNAIIDDNHKILNVHIVPHTHDDVGWRKTVEQYYYTGLNNTLDNRGSVRNIIQTVINALLDNPQRTFTYVEQKFFSMYYNEIRSNPAMLDTIQSLIATKQLIFVNGGWCMHDEATTHFMGMIDQTSLGHMFLKDIFNFIPKVGWQLDPFGHSATQSSLFTSRTGFDSLYFGRIDYQDLNERRSQRQCEGIWNSSINLPNSDVFWGLTGSYEGNYGPPSGGFCYDLMCDANDNIPLVTANETVLMDRILKFLDAIKRQSDETNGQHIMITMGSDFHYQNAYIDYNNIDILINTIMYYQKWNIINVSSIFNDNDNISPSSSFDQINIFYSNPEYYTKQKYYEYIQSTSSKRKKRSTDDGNHKLQQQDEAKRQRNQQSGKHHIDYLEDTHANRDDLKDLSNYNPKTADRVDEGSRKNYNTGNFENRIGGMINYTVKTDDFFPYSDCEHCFWTGFYTSRASFKRYERVTSSFLLAIRQIDAMSSVFSPLNTTTRIENSAISMGKDSHNNSKNNTVREKKTLFDSPIHLLEDVLGIVQHHDAVSGTAKQHVSDDYSKKLQTGIDSVLPYITKILRSIVLQNKDDLNGTEALNDLTYCQLLNETKCSVTEEATALNGTDVYVIVYNALGQLNRSTIVRLPVSMDVLYRIEKVDDVNNVYNTHGNNHSGVKLIRPVHASPLVTPQNCTSEIIGEIDDCPCIQHVLVFDTGVLPPIGGVVFRITKDPGYDKEPVEDASPVTSHRRENEPAVFDVSNDLLRATFDADTGMIIGLATDDVRMNITQTWGYYPSYLSSRANGQNVNSGAYIFRPRIPAQKLISFRPKPGGAKFVKTPVGMEVHATFEETWMKQVTHVVSGRPYIEIEYTVGPIPIDCNIGKEIVSRLSTPIQNNGLFYTDSNAREFIERKYNYRPTWDLKVFEPVAGNYYPVNAAIYIQDSNASLSIVVDRSKGGSSLQDGSIELMVHRRTVGDDSRGVDEPMNETDGGMTPYPPYGNATRIGHGIIVRGKHRIMIGTGNTGASLARSQMDDMFAEPLIFVGSGITSSPVSFRNPSFSGIQVPLPPNVMLVTFARIHHREDENVFLIRLGHQYAIKESTDGSPSPVDVDLSQVFGKYNVISITEKTLGGAEDWKDYLQRRMDWSDGGSTSSPLSRSEERGFTITLSPMEIRTFEVTMASPPPQGASDSLPIQTTR